MADWYVWSGATGTATGASWANAKTTLAAAITAAVAGDTFYVAHDHAETQASALTLTFNGTASSPDTVVCVNRAGSVPPVGADVTTGGSITTTGASALVTVGYLNADGVTLSAGSGASSASMTLAGASLAKQTWKNCTLKQTATNVNNIVIGGASGTAVFLENTTAQFGNTSSQFQVSSNAKLVWRRTLSAIQGATLPTTLIGGATTGVRFEGEGLDLSALGSGRTLFAAQLTGFLKDSKLGASVTGQAAPTNAGYNGVDLIRCDSAGTNYRAERGRYEAVETTETTIVRTSGASDGTTLASRKIVTTANAKWVQPFEAMPFAIWNETIGSSVNVTIEGILDPRTSTSLPNNDAVWFDVEYLSSSSFPTGSFATGTKANALATGTALTASTEAWNSLVTSRANATAYALGDARKVASNPGRVFICTTAGTSAGSEPAGFASAVDGGSVTDGTATFKAAVRFKQTIAVTPNMKGPITVYVRAAVASSTFFIDPKITVS